MIGTKISKKLDGKVVEMRNVKVTLHRGLYHTVDLETPPDVVIGECLCESKLFCHVIVSCTFKSCSTPDMVHNLLVPSLCY